jgi:SLT domain-containing protein
MTKRKLLIAIVSAALATAGLGASVLPAAAEQKTLRVTLVTGQVITCVVDVSVDICPGITGPVADVVEIPAPPASPTVPTPPVPTPGGGGGGGGGGGETSGGGSEEPRPSGGGDQPRPRGDAKRQESSGEKKQRRGSSTDARGEVEGAGERHSGKKKGKRKASEPRDGDLRDAGGAPTLDNPGLSLAVPGAAPIGVPNFFIDKFRIPPFLLSIYQAAGIEYGVRWEVLAAINEIETDYGRNLNVSSAGALGWMQFMPATWKAYGVDANGDRRKDPYNPVDAIFAAARYLKAAGGREGPAQGDLRLQPRRLVRRLVLMRARLIGGMPPTSSARSPA